MRTRYAPLIFIGLGAFVFSMACSTVARLLPSPRTPTPAAVPTIDAAARRLQVFEAVVEAVADNHLQPDQGGLDWAAVAQDYRARAEAASDEAALHQVIRDLLAELPDGDALFESRAERLAAETADVTTYQGIGAYISFRATPEPHIVILSVIRGSPAERAGLQAHDSLYAIDDAPVRADEADTVVERVRGPAGSSVTLLVQSPGQARREVIIQRAEITSGDTVRGGRLGGVVYYRLPVISGADTFELIAQNLQDEGGRSPLTGVILDLRIAASSSTWPLVEMLTLFGDGGLGESYSRADTVPLTVSGVDVGGSQTAPLVILIGPDTRGTPEILAGALQAAGRATLVGLPTPGAVRGFGEFPLPDGSRLFLATSSFRTADGTDLAAAGLTPDVRINLDWDAYTIEDDPVLEAALQLLQDN